MVFRAVVAEEASRSLKSSSKSTHIVASSLTSPLARVVAAWLFQLRKAYLKAYLVDLIMQVVENRFGAKGQSHKTIECLPDKTSTTLQSRPSDSLRTCVRSP